MKRLLVVGLILVTGTAFSQTFDADGNRIDQPPPIPTNPELYATQNRSAEVIRNLVRQDPTYWNGMGAATSARQQAEQRQQVLDAQQRVAPSRPPHMSREDKAAQENALSTANSRFSTRQEKDNAMEAARMIESRSNPNVPAAPARTYNVYEMPRRSLTCTTNLGITTCR